MSAESLKIFQGLAQAAANAYDGAYDEEGKPLEIGLTREDGHYVNDSRTLDGFKIKFAGATLVINYQGEIRLKEVYKGDFEGEIAQRIEDIASYLKKEYKKITGESVTLKADGEVHVLVQNTSRVRTWVQAHRSYSITNVKGTDEILEPSTDKLQDGFQKFLDQGGWDGKRPDNDSRKSA
tara:strand:+ start:686 stop:1225 length:540 start_codon:yes stop_codon:yes gene_type:complete